MATGGANRWWLYALIAVLLSPVIVVFLASFLGRREQFSIPLLMGGTPFQSAVWHELLKIPFGKTTSYDAIAVKLGRINGQRAVGRANGDHRIAIIIPCHRVINADGSLSCYGGGRAKKRWLLAHESRGVQLDLPMD